MTNPWINNLPGPRLAALVEEKGDALKERYHTDDVYFAIWMHAMNRKVQRLLHMHYDDLEDWGYADSYDAGMHPDEAAHDMIIANGLP